MRLQEATFRFFGELNHFRPRDRRQRPAVYTFRGSPAVKDPIEAQGVPHTEVDLIVVNGVAVDFTYPLQAGDHVAVYPPFAQVDISSLKRLRPPAPRASFVLDGHLGKLARILRWLGFDTLYRNDYADPEIIRIGVDRERIILTRDRRMLMHKEVVHARCLHSQKAEEQAREVLERFDLFGRVQLFARCPTCNGLLANVEKERVLDRLEPLTRKHYEVFFQCGACGQIYWQGSHLPKIQQKLAAIGDHAPGPCR